MEDKDNQKDTTMCVNVSKTEITQITSRDGLFCTSRRSRNNHIYFPKTKSNMQLDQIYAKIVS